MSRLQGQISRPMSRFLRVRCCRAGKARPMRTKRNRAGSQQGQRYRLRPALWTPNVTLMSRFPGVMSRLGPKMSRLVSRRDIVSRYVTVSVTQRRDIVTSREARPEGARDITPSRLVPDDRFHA